jgi:hypothetical protein
VYRYHGKRKARAREHGVIIGMVRVWIERRHASLQQREMDGSSIGFCFLLLLAVTRSFFLARRFGDWIRGHAIIVCFHAVGSLEFRGKR